MNDDHENCYACGDLAVRTYLKRPVCEECGNELEHGKIVFGSVHPYGVGGNYGPTDDASPSFDNGVRALEDQ